MGEHTRAWYALRRTLPLWSFEKNLKELVEQLPRYGVDEVIVKVDTEEFTHGQPPLRWVRAYQKHLFKIRDAMAEIGVVFSINPWITVGHCDRGRDDRRKLPGLQTVVGHDGVQCTCCACPLSPVWRKHVAAVWRLYAETRPHVIWVEDDIRTFNHAPARFGCFCPDHMHRFSERVGQRVSREELVDAMLKPGRPHPWRKAYLDMQAEFMEETVSFLAQTVHAVSPETSLGLMSSGPRQHCLEGRRWQRFGDAMADGRPLYSRPPMGNYREASLRGFYYSHDSIKITRHCLPPGTIEQTEVESMPFTQYSKSVAFTFVEMAISFAYGSHGVTMNIFDHCGTPMEDEGGYGRMLRAKKPFLAGLAGKAQPDGVYRGVQLLHHGRQSYVKRLPRRADYQQLAADGCQTMEMLETLGIATTYAESNVVATCGQQLRAYSDAEIEALLGKGLLLDATAACVLAERGFGRGIGLREIQPPEPIDKVGGPFSAEEFYNRRFGGADKKFLTLTMSPSDRPTLSRVKLMRGAEVISRVVDPDARQHNPYMIAFENARGGRVVTHLLDLAQAFDNPFCHPHRAQQLQGVIRWLSRGKPPLFVRGGVYPLAFRKDCDGYTLLGLINLSLDPWPEVVFEFAGRRRPAAMKVLSPGGRWQNDRRLSCEQKGGRTIVRFGGEVPFDQPLFVSVEWG